MSREYKRKERTYEEETALSKEEPMEPETRNGVIIGAPNVNIRSEPSKMSQAIVTVQEGTPVQVLKDVGEFRCVQYTASETSPTLLGYVHSDFCKVVDHDW